MVRETRGTSFRLLLLLLPLAARGARGARVCDAVRDCGAVADNATDAAPALSACVAAPDGPCSAPSSTLALAAGAVFLAGSIDLSNTRNLTVSLGAGAAIFGSGDNSRYPVQRALPPQQGADALPLQWRALIYARNASGLTLEGPPSAVVDGLGWPWWRNFSENRWPIEIQRPKLLEVVDSADITVRGITFRNSAFWQLHPIYCQRVSFLGVTVLAPRSVGNTDGIDIDSCSDVLIDSCHIDVGDDGIAAKSGYRVDDETGAYSLVPTQRVTVRNTTVLSRNVAIGSGCWGNVSDFLMEGGRIGDDSFPLGSSPWAIKLKTHVPFGGVTANITFRGVRLGAIVGTALGVYLSEYGPANQTVPGAPVPAATAYENIVFEDIYAASAVHAGALQAAPPFVVSGLVLRNVTFGKITGGAGAAWTCEHLNNTIADGVQPPMPPGDCGVVGR
jgi:polygalacturonase